MGIYFPFESSTVVGHGDTIDFQNRQYTTTEAEFHENIQAREEFKMLDEDEEVDLLGDAGDIQQLKQAFA